VPPLFVPRVCPGQRLPTLPSASPRQVGRLSRSTWANTADDASAGGVPEERAAQSVPDMGGLTTKSQLGWLEGTGVATAEEPVDGDDIDHHPPSTDGTVPMHELGPTVQEDGLAAEPADAPAGAAVDAARTMLAHLQTVELLARLAAVDGVSVEAAVEHFLAIATLAGKAARGPLTPQQTRWGGGCQASPWLGKKLPNLLLCPVRRPFNAPSVGTPVTVDAALVLVPCDAIATVLFVQRARSWGRRRRRHCIPWRRCAAAWTLSSWRRRVPGGQGCFLH
jgi:hypothetical protein